MTVSKLLNAQLFDGHALITITVLSCYCYVKYVIKLIILNKHTLVAPVLLFTPELSHASSPLHHLSALTREVCSPQSVAEAPARPHVVARGAAAGLHAARGAAGAGAVAVAGARRDALAAQLELASLERRLAARLARGRGAARQRAPPACGRSRRRALAPPPHTERAVRLASFLLRRRLLLLLLLCSVYEFDAA